MYTDCMDNVYGCNILQNISVKSLTLLHSERPKLNGVLAALTAIGLRNTIYALYIAYSQLCIWRYYCGKRIKIHDYKRISVGKTPVLQHQSTY